MIYIEKLYWCSYLPYIATKHFWKGEYFGKIRFSESVYCIIFERKSVVAFTWA